MKKWNAPKAEELNVQKTANTEDVVSDLLNIPTVQCCPPRRS